MSTRPPRHFQPRNAFYLRISATTVLQMLLFLDAAHDHQTWMTEDILERVLAALKPRIITKLGAESEILSKKRREQDSEKVDVFRGAGWQMAYFFRKTIRRHSLLLKNKTVVWEESPSASKQPQTTTVAHPFPQRKRKAVEIQDDHDEEDDVVSALQKDHASTAHLRMSEPIHIKEEDDEDSGLQPASSMPLFAAELPEEDEEDEKPNGKPRLRVSYTGFSIFGKTLVVIVEPYPPLDRPAARAETDGRELSVAPRIVATPAPPDTRDRSRSMSFVAPRDPTSRLFRRPTTPLREFSQTPDLDDFRMRSQSVLSIARAVDNEEIDEADAAHRERMRSASVAVDDN